jgi:acyl-CoA synthetase (AMP-forming)/AMP-acid ligase II
MTAAGSATVDVNLLDQFRRQVQERPDQPIYIYLGKNAEELHRVTYAAFFAEAMNLARALKLPVGARVLLDFPTDMQFVTALWACLLSGCVAVPIASARSETDRLRLQAILEDIQPQCVLYSARRAAFWQAAPVAQYELRAYEDLPVVAGASDPVYHVQDIDLALVQYTSGTTGQPKGVCITHANLAANAQFIQAHFNLQPGEILVSWLPHYHDMGLIGKILQAPFFGGTLAFMEPLSFLARPINWFIALSRYQARGTAAPNFAYDHCCERINPEQLESIRLSPDLFMANGSEVVHAQTLERFCAFMRVTGLQQRQLLPTYGMAETTLFVSGKALNADLQWQTLSNDVAARPMVLHGSTSPLQVRIVNPQTYSYCSDGEVGEIWLQGANISQGYWGRPALNALQFRALTARGEGPFFRTGDLGALLESGELVITGRLKDLIIVRGKNFFPQDIETVAETVHELCRPGFAAAFALQSDGVERAVLIQELQKNRGAQPSLTELAARVRQSVAAQLALDLDQVLFVRQGVLPTTSSGKIQRNLCREQFLRGDLPLLQE